MENEVTNIKKPKFAIATYILLPIITAIQLPLNLTFWSPFSELAFGNAKAAAIPALILILAMFFIFDGISFVLSTLNLVFSSLILFKEKNKSKFQYFNFIFSIVMVVIAITYLLLIILISQKK